MTHYHHVAHLWMQLHVHTCGAMGRLAWRCRCREQLTAKIGVYHQLHHGMHCQVCLILYTHACICKVHTRMQQTTTGATHQQLHVVHAPHPRCTLATTASMLLPTAQQSTNNSNQHPRMCTLSCVSRFRVYDEISLSALLHTQQPWQLRIQSDADELGQQWGVTCSTREWQAAARCRVGNEAWWVTPVLCMRKLDTWHSEFSLMLDVEL